MFEKGTRSTGCATAKKKARPDEDEPREDRQECRERLSLLLVHACLTPTRQAMMMVHVRVGAVCGHVRKVLSPRTLVNRAARRMHRRRENSFTFLLRENCAAGGL